MGQELNNVGQRDFDLVIDGTRSGPRHGADERGKFVIDPVDQLVQQNAFQVDFPFQGNLRHGFLLFKAFFISGR
jgi:hypothetical protein